MVSCAAGVWLCGVEAFPFPKPPTIKTLVLAGFIVWTPYDIPEAMIEANPILVLVVPLSAASGAAVLAATVTVVTPPPGI